MTDAPLPAPRASARTEPAPLLAGRIVEFVRLVRANHFRVGVQESLDAVNVAACVNMADQRQLRWGLRSLLCSDPADWRNFDRLFDRYWQRPNAAAVEVTVSGSIDRAESGARAAPDRPTPPSEANEGEDPRQDALRVGASRRDAITRSDFRLAQLNQDTHALEQWIEQLARRMRKRLLRRHQIRSAGSRIHLRRTVRRSLSHGGLPLELLFHERRRELPRLVLITDVSRSMNVYSYFFLRFARGIIDAFRDTDAFVFHTRLVPVTDTLRERDAHRLKEKLAWIAAGWGGGTRIGESLQAFNREHARRLVDSRTCVFIVSDGYDTGEPALLGEEVRRLRRRARRVVWLNPLLGRDDYAPTAGGMQAALPHLDLFAPAHNLESLMKIEHLLARW
ncbi:aerobic carbon monoxide dehydrogenase, CoxE accessory protein [Burkholderiales bacterium]|nr:aerobic carbon monoxide dehydrogenase, CoxE accessory protein [Burkholderiales bacterium]